MGKWFYIVAMLCVLGAMNLGGASADDCPFFFSGHLKRADVILVGELDVQDYVGYKRAKLKQGEKDVYAAERAETPLWKWKINRFKVIDVLKGNAKEIGETTQIVSPRYFTRGQHYVIFARKTKNLKRYDKTGGDFVNEGCDKTEHIAKDRGSDLLRDVQDEFGLKETGFPRKKSKKKRR